MRLQKYLAACGVASRRKCENLIIEGRVSVNGAVAEIGCVIDPDNDSITLDGKSIYIENRRVVLLFYKPRGVVCSNSDPEGRKTVTSYFSEFDERLFNVGRLDINSEGLIIMTNDGKLAQAMTHPSYEVEKTYYVECAGALAHEEIAMLEKGVMLDDGLTAPARVTNVKSGEGRTSFRIAIHEGKNRQVRRMVEAVGHKTLRLRRERIGKLTLTGIAPGAWREATSDEIQYLDRCIIGNNENLYHM